MKSKHLSNYLLTFVVFAASLISPLNAQSEDEAALARKIASVRDEFSTMDLEYFLDVYVAGKSDHEFFFTNIINKKSPLVRQCRIIKQTSDWLEQVKAFSLRENDKITVGKVNSLLREIGMLRIEQVAREIKEDNNVNYPVYTGYSREMSGEDYDATIKQLDKNLKRVFRIKNTNNKINNFWNVFFDINKEKEEVKKLNLENPLNPEGILFEQGRKVDRLNEVAYGELKRVDRIRRYNYMTLSLLTGVPFKEFDLLSNYINEGKMKIATMIAKLDEHVVFWEDFVMRLNDLNENPTEEKIQEFAGLIIKNRTNIHSNYRIFYIRWVDVYRNCVKPVVEVVTKKYSRIDLNGDAIRWFWMYDNFVKGRPLSSAAAKDR
ncbi:hypothetical protein [Ereboglobus luteus]|uniref:Uncharacterized protein n=1 Tax=Ereboglobus luteus TaxID=1796921 RepID=A0A2U8E4H7_9BACT|nr:hypothetical protein [Ereboglobus luteus]AWI09726.1 hypothetical protein CKA38_11105 [Ereboglobus luteus]